MCWESVFCFCQGLDMHFYLLRYKFGFMKKRKHIYILTWSKFFKFYFCCLLLKPLVQFSSELDIALSFTNIQLANGYFRVHQKPFRKDLLMCQLCTLWPTRNTLLFWPWLKSLSSIENSKNALFGYITLSLYNFHVLLSFQLIIASIAFHMG